MPTAGKTPLHGHGWNRRTVKLRLAGGEGRLSKMDSRWAASGQRDLSCGIPRYALPEFRACSRRSRGRLGHGIRRGWNTVGGQAWHFLNAPGRVASGCGGCLSLLSGLCARLQCPRLARGILTFQTTQAGSPLCRFPAFPAAASPPPGTRENEVSRGHVCSLERKHPAGKPRALH